MDYDNDILGVVNSQHPANEKETESFVSIDLQECLDYYKDTRDLAPLENAIFENESNKKRAIKDLTEVIKLQRSKGDNNTANFLALTRDLLK